MHVTRLSGLPGRRSDVIVINAMLPLLQEQFEGTQVRMVAPEGAGQAASGAAAMSVNEEDLVEETDEVQVMVWSLRLDEAKVPWAVFHSHVVSTARGARARGKRGAAC